MTGSGSESPGLQSGGAFVGMIVRTKRSPVTAGFTVETIMENRSAPKGPTRWAETIMPPKRHVANIKRAVNMIFHNRIRHEKTSTWTPPATDSSDQTAVEQIK